MVHVPPPPVLVVRPQQSGARGGRYLLITLVWIVSLLLAFGTAGVLRDRLAISGDNAAIRRVHADNEALQQRIVVLERSEQVARAANIDLQQNLRDRQEEISALRADLGFYSRLTGGGSRREGLSVQNVHLEAGANARVYNFTLTLTQNLKGGQIGGHVRVSVSGVQADKLTTLTWTDLAPNQNVAGLGFSFKYFQQITGTLMLPDAFKPNRIQVLADADGEQGRVDREFAWSEALANSEISNVSQ